ncbi:hypothetical protein [Microbacterium sp. LWH12-1.2]|uniref:hypothetical protein n=1 Tax=Microbacterium sp. LWH12-1.2 TaxID=3135259 RepID=UPI0034366026
MNEFVASNGVKVWVDGISGIVSVASSNVKTFPTERIDPVDAIALREFFQHERDEELGRWRSTIDANWTAALDAETGWVQFRKDDGLHEFSMTKRNPSLTGWSSCLQAIGREYLDAHPERKPWEDATPGQVWDVDLEYGGVRAVVVYSARHAEPIAVFRDPYTQVEYETDDSTIRDARRIYPESDHV